MDKTLVGYFDDRTEAQRTQQDLLAHGFDPQDVDVVFQDDEPASAGEKAASLWEKMKTSLGFESDEDRSTYEEATRHGGALVAVRADDGRLDDAATIIEQHHPADLDQRMAEWRPQAGQTTAAQAGEDRIPVVQEELRAGKRAVRRGAVRIHTHVTEQPVEEQLSLEEERVTVERRPASGHAAAGEDAFQERTIEVEEKGEEPVVAKEARVVEEVTVGKEKEKKQAQVRDTVRRTDVDVERTNPSGPKQ